MARNTRVTALVREIIRRNTGLHVAQSAAAVDALDCAGLLISDDELIRLEDKRAEARLDITASLPTATSLPTYEWDD